MRYENGEPEPDQIGSDFCASWALVIVLFLGLFLL